MVVLGSTALTLPIITSTTNCANFALTVKPYIPQFYNLPSLLLDAVKKSDGKLAAVHDVYLQTNPVVFGFFLALVLSLFFFLAAEINKNYSQVDRFWSILPTVYNAHYWYWATQHGLPTQRLSNVLMFSVIWSTRLTFNYWRRGGYSIGSEDYRWEIVKNYVGPVVMFFFDISFIAVAQNILLFAITTPTYILLLLSRYTKEDMNTSDIVFSRILVLLVLVEFFADQQQWNFHQAKNQYQKDARIPPESKYTQSDLDRGFNVSGLWSWSRHPNFAAEQAIWVSLYQWACYESQTFINWTFGGALAYLILFQASTWLTELLSANKYPEYKEYQRLVGKFLPRMLGQGVAGMEEVKKGGKKSQ